MVRAEVTPGGELSFEGRIAGRIQGFRYTPEGSVREEPAPVDDGELAGVIAKEFEARADRLSEAVDSALVLANDGAIRWLGEPIAKIASGAALLAPQALILADETLTQDAQEKARSRVSLWLDAYVRRLLGPLFDLESGVGLEGPARNVAAQLVENLGVLERGRVAQDVKALEQNARGILRKLGVRFGAYYIYVPSLVKPAIRVLATQLWALRQGAPPDGASLHDIPQMAASGRTSFLADSAVPKETYRVAGFRLCGDRAVRVDIVERLADLIRPAVAYRPGLSAGEPPPGSADGDGFVVTGAMTSLTGCSGEQFASVLRSLGFVSRLMKGPALTPSAKAPDVPAAAENPTNAIDAPSAASEADLAAAGGADSGDAGIEADEAPTLAANPAPGCDARPEPSDGPPGTAGDGSVETGAPNSPLDADAPAARPPGLPAAVQNAQAEPGSESVAQEQLVEVWRPRPPSRHRGAQPGARARATARPRQPEAQPGGREEAAEAGGQRAGRTPPPQRTRIAGQAEPRQGEDRGRFRSGRGPGRSSEAARRTSSDSGERGAPSPGASRDERLRRDRRPEPVAAVPRREAPINLDSPFAKLLALKLRMEAKDKDD